MVIVLSPCRPRRLAALGLQRDQKSGSILALPLVASYHCRIPLVRYPWRRGASRDTSTWLMIATESHAARTPLSSLSLSLSPIFSLRHSISLFPRVFLSFFLSFSLFSSFPPLSSWPSLSCSSLFQQPLVMPAALLPLPLQPPEHNTESAIELFLVTFFFLSSFTDGSHERCWLFDVGSHVTA